MKVYLAASWSRRIEMQSIAAILRSMGVEVNSRWLKEQDGPVHGREKHRRETALIDVADVKSCDALVRFSDDLSGVFVPAHLATGARMFETGMAYSLGKPIYVVGGKQNVFDSLPNIIHVKDVDALTRELCPQEIH